MYMHSFDQHQTMKLQGTGKILFIPQHKSIIKIKKFNLKSKPGTKLITNDTKTDKLKMALFFFLTTDTSHIIKILTTKF